MFKKCRHIVFFTAMAIGKLPLHAQNAALNFHHLSVKNGLKDGIINAITEDKYGYMWFASYGALNRYNSTSVKKYEHVIGDSTSAPGGIVRALYCSSNGRLFIGGEDGLREFNYNTGKFIPVISFNKFRVTAISELSSGELLVVGNNAPWQLNLQQDEKKPLLLKTAPEISAAKIFSLYKKKNLIYMGVKGGYLLYDVNTGRVKLYAVPQLKDAAADAVMPDVLGNIWINNIFQFRLLKIDAVTGVVTEMDKHPQIIKYGVQQQFLDFAADNDHVWIATSLKGLLQYNVHTGAICNYQNNLLKPGSIANNILRALYLSKNGTVWISMLGGVIIFTRPEIFLK